MHIHSGVITWFVGEVGVFCLIHVFSGVVSYIHVERNVPMALVGHSADYYKKGCHDRCLIQKL